MQHTTTSSLTWSRQDLVIGTAIAAVMVTLFTLLSSGLSLILTFVPGVLFSWLLYVWLVVKQVSLPDGTTFLPLFFTLLSLQFIHFAEEFTTGFRSQFPLLYGGTPYTDTLFVTFNMIAYCVFALTCILTFTRNMRFLLLPAMFFIVYGAIGNAISHTWWSLYLGAYFPGLFTAQLFWLLGPLVLLRLLGQRKVVVATIVLFAVVLIVLLTLFASPHALAAGI